MRLGSCLTCHPVFWGCSSCLCALVDVALSQRCVGWRNWTWRAPLCDLPPCSVVLLIGVCMQAIVLLSLMGVVCMRLLCVCAGLFTASSSSFTGLPPRSSNSPLDSAVTASAQHSTPQQQLGWRPHRLSGTDMGNGSSSSWCAGAAGPLTASLHVGFAPGHAGSGCASGHVSHMTPSPLLGSSPSSSSMPGCSGGGLPASLLGTSPHIMSASWAAGELHSRSSSAGGACGPGGHRVLGPECSALSYMSASPAGSCSSSWTGTSPLAAAAAAGVSSLRGLSSSSCEGASGGGGGSEWPLGGSLPAGGLAAAMAAVGRGDGGGVLLAEQQQQLVLKEEPVLADYSQLPEKCWMDVLQRLGVRELCCAARVNT